jgi:hypothetical protein
MGANSRPTLDVLVPNQLATAFDTGTLAARNEFDLQFLSREVLSLLDPLPPWLYSTCCKRIELCRKGSATTKSR